MNVELMNHTPMNILVTAIRTCWDSGDLSDSFYPKVDQSLFALGPKDKKLIQTVIKKNHTSTLEHLTYNFKIEGISRLNLQELARHRMASLSVKSTRYTLKELKDERDFYYFDDELNLFEDWDRITKYINLTGVKTVDRTSMFALNNLKELIQLEITNDIAKYVLPECYKVDLIWSINARSLRNFLSLRTDPSAHFEIRTLAKNIYNCIPEGHKFIFEDSLSQVEGAGNATN